MKNFLYPDIEEYGYKPKYFIDGQHLLGAKDQLHIANVH